MSRVVRFAQISAALSLVTASSFVAAPAALGAPGASHSRADELRSRLGAGARIVAASGGTLHFAAAAAHRAGARPADIGAGDAPATAARGWLRHYGATFGVADQARDLPVAHVTGTGAGNVVAFGQTVGGVPVTGASVVVSMDHSNQLLSVNARVTAATSAPSHSLASSVAQRTAVARLERSTHRHDLTASAPHLEVFDSSVVGGDAAPAPVAVWATDVTSADRSVRHAVYVDATRGSVVVDIDKNPQAQRIVCSGGTGTTAAPDPTCTSSGTPNPVVATSATPPVAPSSGGDADTYNAFRFAGAVDDFYSKVLNRNSLDNSGMTLASTVHFCQQETQDPTQTPCPMVNAFWDGQEMVYGNNFASALDVVGHEMTHGVTEHMSNLFEYYQSGAINESTSDIMGELIQQIEGPIIAPSDTTVYDPTKRWSVGEDLGVPQFVRHMDDPTTDSPADPDSMTSPNYNAFVPSDQSFDSGGVHANDGVGNKTAFLITDGGSLNGVTVPGMSTQVATDADQQVVERDVKTANVYYQLESLMNSSTDYADLANLLPAACNQLLTANKPLPLPLPFSPGTTTSLTSADCASVTAATQATRLATRPTLAGAAIPTAATVTCTNGGKPTTLRVDKFDTTSPATAGYTRGHAGSDGFAGAFGNFWWSKQNIDDYGPGSTLPTYARSGDGTLWGDDSDPSAAAGSPTPDREDAWAVSPAITVRPATFVNFAHAWEFDYGPASASGPSYNYDGGVVEYSVNNGISWTDAGSLITAGKYNGVVSNTDNLYFSGYFDPNPLVNRHAFVGSSHGWTASRMDLSSLAGKSVKIRWRIGADDMFGSLGWYIDDVNVYSCNPTTVSISAPTSIVYGHSATVTAHLVRSGTTTVVAGQPVQLYQRRHGTTAWVATGAPRATNSSGNAAFGVHPLVTYDFGVRFVSPGATSYAPSNLAGRVVSVTYAVSKTLSTTKVTRGHKFTVSGRVLPNAHGLKVSLQRYYAGKWHTLATKALTSTSRYSFSYAPTVSGRLTFRVIKAGGRGLAAGTANFHMSVT